jgi:pseudouridine-5'-phosphate glycosidase
MIYKNINPEVEHALRNNVPVVALESTIITHGMPYPENLKMVHEVEAIIRENNAVPATIAILDGVIKIGLTISEVKKLSETQGVKKLSRADLSSALTNGNTGATTVSATMILAANANIKVFATGGVGGVHIGAENTFDISADLQELSQTPVIVISAGPKAILDLPKTLEVLETLGVPVVTFGQDELPAFWSRSSGLKSPIRMDSAREIACSQLTREALSIPGGQLVANPIPIDAEIPLAEILPIIRKANLDAKKDNIYAKDLTPFLLSKIFQYTQGESLKANIELVKNNARLACEIAASLIEEEKSFNFFFT